jgi:hypothetical protein
LWERVNDVVIDLGHICRCISRERVSITSGFVILKADFLQRFVLEPLLDCCRTVVKVTGGAGRCDRIGHSLERCACVQSLQQVVVNEVWSVVETALVSSSSHSSDTVDVSVSVGNFAGQRSAVKHSLHC